MLPLISGIEEVRVARVLVRQIVDELSGHMKGDDAQALAGAKLLELSQHIDAQLKEANVGERPHLIWARDIIVRFLKRQYRADDDATRLSPPPGSPIGEMHP